MMIRDSREGRKENYLEDDHLIAWIDDRCDCIVQALCGFVRYVAWMSIRLTSVAPTVVVISVKGFKSLPMIGL